MSGRPMSMPALIAALRGPLMLICLGALLAIDQMEILDVSRTWPAILILFGRLKLAEAVAGSGGGQEPAGGSASGGGQP